MRPTIDFTQRSHVPVNSMVQQYGSAAFNDDILLPFEPDSISELDLLSQKVRSATSGEEVRNEIETKFPGITRGTCNDTLETLKARTELSSDEEEILREFVDEMRDADLIDVDALEEKMLEEGYGVRAAGALVLAVAVLVAVVITVTMP